MKKNSESFNIARQQYINGYLDNNERIFPTLDLVAKEFISTRVEKDGVLILSEMAGASKELFQAVLVNPFDLNNMAEALYQAVNMTKVEQVERNRKMRKRLKRYNVEHWAKEFMKGLNLQSKNKIKSSATLINENVLKKIKEETVSEAKVELEPKLEGRQAVMILAPEDKTNK